LLLRTKQAFSILAPVIGSLLMISVILNSDK
jgi:hypothetical protein